MTENNRSMVEALFTAIRHHDMDEVDTLLEQKPNLVLEKCEYGNNVLHEAITAPSPVHETVEHLFRDEKTKAMLNEPNIYGITPLMFAAAKGKSTVVRMLLAEGAKHDLTDDNGLTALDHAKNNGTKRSTEYLEAAENGEQITLQQATEEQNNTPVNKPKSKHSL